MAGVDAQFRLLCGATLPKPHGKHSAPQTSRRVCQFPPERTHLLRRHILWVALWRVAARPRVRAPSTAAAARSVAKVRARTPTGVGCNRLVDQVLANLGVGGLLDRNARRLPTQETRLTGPAAAVEGRAGVRGYRVCALRVRGTRWLEHHDRRTGDQMKHPSFENHGGRRTVEPIIGTNVIPRPRPYGTSWPSDRQLAVL